MEGLARPLDGPLDHLESFDRVTPALDLDPLARFQILVVLEEVRNLVDQDLGELAIAGNLAVVGMQGVDRYREYLLVLALFILHHQHTDRPYLDDSARHDRVAAEHQHIDRITVIRQRVRHEAVVAGVMHRRVQEAVDVERAGILVQLVLHRLASHWHLDDHIDLEGGIVSDRYPVDQHGKFTPANEWGHPALEPRDVKTRMLHCSKNPSPTPLRGQ